MTTRLSILFKNNNAAIPRLKSLDSYSCYLLAKLKLLIAKA